MREEVEESVNLSKAAFEGVSKTMATSFIALREHYRARAAESMAKGEVALSLNFTALADKLSMGTQIFGKLPY